MIKIIDLKAGDEGVLFDALVKHIVTGKTNGANRATYLSLNLQDETGYVDAKLWAATPQQVESIVVGSVITIKGDVIKYNEDRQVKIIKAHVKSNDPMEQVKYLKQAPEDASVLFEEVQAVVDSMTNNDLQAILQSFLTKYKEQFLIYPAASKNHHEYVSGLIHHTTSMLRLAMQLCILYPTLDRDLLASGVILHDLGKVIELSGPVIPEYTLQGKLLGHISISQAMIKNTADELGITSESVVLLQHMVLSHHGKNEYGSPVVPLLKEAEILYLIDNLDARMNMMDKALDLVEEGEFTKRVFALENRSLYKPKK